jgi:UTP--glucose-1-phosphate uridylyltransferase
LWKNYQKIMSSERIVTNLIDSRQVTSMMSSMSKPGGRLVRGIPSFMPDETFTQLEFDRDRADASQEWMGSFFGEYGDRYLMVAPGSENLKAEDVTAIGGVCAIRSSDMALLQNGAIADPESGEVTAYSSAEQVAEWIERSVSIDQAIESIGLFKGQNYAVISEEKLWMKRIVSAVGANINLSQIDVDRLAESLQRAETMRLNMIQKYISYAKGQQMDIRFFSDKDLIENLRMGGEKKRPLLEEIEKISSMANFIYVRQKGPYGNGTPLMNVRHIVGNEPFIYAFSDDFIHAAPKSRFQQLVELYDEFECSILSSIRAEKEVDYDRYGFAGGDEIRPGIISAKVIIEKPGMEAAPSDLANVSSTVLSPEIFNYLDRASENLKDGDELYYNDALKLMIEDGRKVIAAEIAGGKYYDTGNKLEYMKTVVEFALEHPEINGKFREFLKGLDL